LGTEGVETGSSKHRKMKEKKPKDGKKPLNEILKDNKERKTSKNLISKGKGKRRASWKKVETGA